MKLWFCLASAFFAPAALAAGGWMHYHNERFGASIDIPPGFVRQPDPVNGDGNRFMLADGTATLSVWGSNIAPDQFADYAQRLIGYDKDGGWIISYRSTRRDWVVFSGSKGSDIVYEKIISACHGDQANHFRLEYPAKDQKLYGPIIARLAKSLRTGEAYDC